MTIPPINNNNDILIMISICTSYLVNILVDIS